MKQWRILMALAVLSGAAAAQEAGETRVAYDKVSFPFEGEVTVTRLNVRLFPGTGADSIIAAVASSGDKLTVVAEKDGYYQVSAPRGATAWIFARSVQRSGETGTVSAQDVPVRLDSRVTARSLCELKQGTPVRIVGQHMGWYKIEAPKDVKYFVAKKYVRTLRALATPTPFEAVADADGAGKPAAGSDFRGKLDAAGALLDAQKALVESLRLDEVNFTGFVAALEEAKAAAATDAERSEADRMLDYYKDVHLAWEKIRREILEAKVAEQQKLLELQKREPAPKTWTMTGYVDTTGLLWKRPGTHKLVMGGKIVCFLRVREGDKDMVSTLNGKFRRYVGVNGTLVKDPEGWEGYSVVVVDEIEEITPE